MADEQYWMNEGKNVLCAHTENVHVRVCFLGYAFLLFQEESSVQALIEACMEEDGKLYLCVSSPTIKDKPVSLMAPAHTEKAKVLSLKNFQNNQKVDLMFDFYFRCKFVRGT